MKLGAQLTLVAAEGVAVQALTFLAGEPARLAGFLNTTELNPEQIRQAAAQPGFLLGVLDYVGSDDRLVAEFAAATGCKPDDIARAYQALGGAPWERAVP